MNPLVTFVKKVPLIEQIAIGLVIGIMLAVFVPSAVPFVSIFGDLFVSALKGVASSPCLYSRYERHDAAQE